MSLLLISLSSFIVRFSCSPLFYPPIAIKISIKFVLEEINKSVNDLCVRSFGGMEKDTIKRDI